MSDSIERAVDALENFIREDISADTPVPLHEPSFEGNEWKYLKDCLDSGWVSSIGSYVDQLEKETAEVCGTKYGIATVNGVSALHAALIGVGTQANDIVICPALTFIATANAISYCGAVPLFADSENVTFGLDPDKLEQFLKEECVHHSKGLVHRQSGRRIAAIAVVHVFGHPARMDELLSIAQQYLIPVVEDAAEALGSHYKERPCGGLSQVGVISFNGNKTITTGGGGLISTNDEVMARRLKHLTTTARTGQGWNFDHDKVGFNYRMPNLNAALGCAQLEMLPEFIERKRRLAKCYRDLFKDVDDVSFVSEQNWARSNYWLCAIRVPDIATRDYFLQLSNHKKLLTRPCWHLIPETNAYQNSLKIDNLSVAKHLAETLINIPSSPILSVAMDKH